MSKKRVVIIKGKKVSLVVPEKQDVEIWYKGFNDVNVSTPLGNSNKLFYYEEREKFYENISNTSEKIFFSIMENDSGNIIGYIKYNEISHFHKKAYFSLAIFDKNIGGKGYGTETIRLFLDYSFRIQGLRKVILRHYDFNEVGSHIYKKVGFKLVGILKKDSFVDGEYRDRIIMEIFKDEFYELNKEFLKKER